MFQSALRILIKKCKCVVYTAIEMCGGGEEGVTEMTKKEKIVVKE